jgi:hypothetical protein
VRAHDATFIRELLQVAADGHVADLAGAREHLDRAFAVQFEQVEDMLVALEQNVRFCSSLFKINIP